MSLPERELDLEPPTPDKWKLSGRQPIALLAIILLVLAAILVFRDSLPWSSRDTGQQTGESSAVAIATQGPPPGIALEVSPTASGQAPLAVATWTPGAPSSTPTATQPVRTPTATPSGAVAPRTPGPTAIATRPATAPTPSPTRVVSVSPNGERSYVVQTGDTLLQIANDLGVSVGEIMKANDLTDQNRLQVGQRLVIPVR